MELSQSYHALYHLLLYDTTTPPTVNWSEVTFSGSTFIYKLSQSFYPPYLKVRGRPDYPLEAVLGMSHT